jgi:hypothetical protein
MDSAGYYLVKAQHALHTGRRAMSVAYCDSVASVMGEWDRDAGSVVARTGGNAVIPLAFIASAHACRGRVSERRRVEDALREVLRHSHSLFDEMAVPFALGNAAVFAGERDSAVAQLERALKPPTGVWPQWLRVDPFYASLRGHPRFEAILARTPQ